AAAPVTAPPVPARPTSAPGAASPSGAVPPQRPASSPVTAPRASLTDVVPRRTLAIIAAVIVLAVLGTVLALTLGGGDDKPDDSGGKNAGASAPAGTPSPDAPSGSSDAAQGGSGTEQDAGKGEDKGQDDDAEKQGEDGKKGGKAEDAVPAGYRAVTNKRFHFSIAMPKGFHFDTTSGQGAGAIYNAKGGFPRLQVDYTSSPGNDAAASWNSARGGVAASSTDYHHLGIQKVQYNGYPTVADWQFERTQQGQRVRVLNRGFKADSDHGYAIMISCKADEWDGKECRTLRKAAFASFEPVD
ncbi:serine/threonine protein kinase, partial [Streptomyces sp. SID9727]|nr:serine/threonine protein kinase [Streptomyces sp. SID9727]